MNASLTNAAGTGAASAQPMTDIRDIKPILHLPGVEWLPVAFTVLGCILLAVLIWFTWRWWKKRTRKETQIPALPPHEQAFRDLDLLQTAQDLADKPYYFRISQILRAYVGARFHVNALEMTTEELIPVLKKTSLTREGLKDIRTFCASSDMVKYAAAEVGIQRRITDHDLVRSLVARTAEQPETADKQPEPPASFDTMPKTIQK